MLKPTTQSNDNHGLALAPPRCVPALDPAFRPAALANRNFLRGAKDNGVAVGLALERADGSVSRHAARVTWRGFTQSATTARPRVRLVAQMA